jgi:hypothetical protein
MSYGTPYQNNPYGNGPSTEAGYGQVCCLPSIFSFSSIDLSTASPASPDLYGPGGYDDSE